jgi:streptomycin 6-kinase
MAPPGPPTGASSSTSSPPSGSFSWVRPPTGVVQEARTPSGAAAREWLVALPGIVAEVAERWSLTLGPQYRDGFVACVFPASRPGGERVVLKVGWIEDETRHEPDALALWDGDGAVRLLGVDRALGAMLMERAEPGTPLSNHPDPDLAITIGCTLLRRLWRPVESEHPFPLVADLALRLAQEFPQEFESLGRPFDAGLVAEAVRTCLDLARWNGAAVLANRDFHFGNVLAAQREPWLVIDPKPLVGEPAFDTGHLLRDLLGARGLDRATVELHVGRLAAELGLERDRIRAWAFVRSVDNALWTLGTGQGDVRWDVQAARLLAPR